MIMQHKGISGTPIAVDAGECFRDRMRRLTGRIVAEGARATEKCRISGAIAPWFALRVWTGREKAVENTLDALGVQSLVPMRKGPDLRRRGRTIEGQMMPVICGYVLVRMLPRPEYLAGLQGVEHAIAVLGGCEHPLRVSEQEVSKFNAMACDGAYDWERPVAMTVKAGEQLRITDGPFADCRAVVVTPSRNGRGDVVVTIDFMGGEVALTVPLALLAKL